MKALRYHEDIQRGSLDFPLDYHLIDERHARYDMPYHWHEEVEILHVLTGEFPLVIDGSACRLRAGDVAYIASGRLHGGTPEGCVYECVVFDMRLLLKSNDHCRGFISDVISRKVDVSAYLPNGSRVTRHTILPMFEALREHSDGYALITLGCLFQFVGEAYKLRAYTLHDAPPTSEARSVLKLKKVFELIESRVANPPTLSELSACVGMSPKYFCRFFKQATHRAPMDYISFYRIELACYEMAATEKNVTEIALDVGFGDLNYFIRCFKKHKGVTPKRYLTGIREGRAVPPSRPAEDSAPA